MLSQNLFFIETLTWNVFDVTATKNKTPTPTVAMAGANKLVHDLDCRRLKNLFI